MENMILQRKILRRSYWLPCKLYYLRIKDGKKREVIQGCNILTAPTDIDGNSIIRSISTCAIRTNEKWWWFRGNSSLVILINRITRFSYCATSIFSPMINHVRFIIIQRQLLAGSGGEISKHLSLAHMRLRDW